jgi:hypothetical protein
MENKITSLFNAGKRFIWIMTFNLFFFSNMVPQIHLIQKFIKALNVFKLRVVKVTLICVVYVKSANENLIPTTEHIYWQLL